MTAKYRVRMIMCPSSWELWLGRDNLPVGICLSTGESRQEALCHAAQELKEAMATIDELLMELPS